MVRSRAHAKSSSSRTEESAFFFLKNSVQWIVHSCPRTRYLLHCCGAVREENSAYEIKIASQVQLWNTVVVQKWKTTCKRVHEKFCWSPTKQSCFCTDGLCVDRARSLARGTPRPQTGIGSLTVFYTPALSFGHSIPASFFIGLESMQLYVTDSWTRTPEDEENNTPGTFRFEVINWATGNKERPRMSSAGQR